MKKILAILIVLVICLSFSGCDYSILSVDSLMRPPKLSGESRLLQKAFEESVSDIEGIIMKTPISGQNRSSYLFFDLDNDGTDEALVFYSNPMEDICAYVSIFKSIGNEWENISVIKGKSEEIYEVNFADINGDSVFEIFLSWTGMVTSDKVVTSDFGTSNDRVLTVYGLDDNTTTLLKTEIYTNLFYEDLNNDYSDEIVIFRINLTDNEKRTTARILSFNDDYSVGYDEIHTLTGFLEIHNIKTDTIQMEDDSHTRIFVDGSVSEIGVLTELIDINKETFEIQLPLLEQNKSQQPRTLRDSRVYCQDIDDDGLIEIPTLEVLPYSARVSENDTERKVLNLTVWSEFVDNEFKTDFKCLMNSSLGYMFKMPEDVINNITAVYDDNGFILKFYNIDTDGTYLDEIVSIKTFLEPDWEKNDYDYTKISENKTYVYGMLISDSVDEEKIKDFINENFCILNQE